MAIEIEQIKPKRKASGAFTTAQLTVNEIGFERSNDSKSYFVWNDNGTLRRAVMDPNVSGWTPVLAVVSDGERRVLQITDWTGGTGVKPSVVNQFIGATGIVNTAALAVDIRGDRGNAGLPGPIGPAGLVWRGVWNNATAYVLNDAVGFNGASYFCVAPITGGGNPGTNATNWALLAAQGAPGPYTNIAIGTVTTLDEGVAATATLTQVTPGNMALNLGLPKGASGEDGASISLRYNDAPGNLEWESSLEPGVWNVLIPTSEITPVVSVGSTTTGAPGTNASVTPTSTAEGVSLAFSIPRGKNVSIRRQGANIEWQEEGATTWTTLLPLADIKGDQGFNVVLQTTATHIQWKTTDPASNWANLIALEDITGDPGSNIELRTSATHIEWRVVGGITWTPLVALDSLEGAPGKNIELTKSATHIQWRLAGTADAYQNLVPLADITGENIELRKHAGHIEWKVVSGSTWTQLIALSEITGDDGVVPQWDTDASYAVNQVVQDGQNFYVCIANADNTTTAPSTNTTNWRLITVPVGGAPGNVLTKTAGGYVWQAPTGGSSSSDVFNILDGTVSLATLDLSGANSQSVYLRKHYGSGTNVTIGITNARNGQTIVLDVSSATAQTISFGTILIGAAGGTGLTLELQGGGSTISIAAGARVKISLVVIGSNAGGTASVNFATYTYGTALTNSSVQTVTQNAVVEFADISGSALTSLNTSAGARLTYWRNTVTGNATIATSVALGSADAGRRIYLDVLADTTPRTLTFPTGSEMMYGSALGIVVPASTRMKFLMFWNGSNWTVNYSTY